MQIKFFAILREQAGLSSLECSTCASTPGELYQELQVARSLRFPVNLLRVSVNERYAAMDTLLQAGDRVAFIPPVAGG